jgi:hypothetical protein
MATLPTSEESGRKILSMYGEYNVRPGEMLQLRTINVKWMKSMQRSEDLIAGLEWLGEMEFIEQKDGKSQDVFFLTEKGFAAI